MVEYYIFIVVLVFMKVLFWIVFCAIRAQPKEKHWGKSAPRPRRININDRSAIIDFEVLPDGFESNPEAPSHIQCTTNRQTDPDLHPSFAYPV